MNAQAYIPEFSYSEPTLREELAQSGSDPVLEMANLSADQTGVEGVIFISTSMGSHGPRVKYFVRPGKDQPSFSVSIEEEPEVKANSLPPRVLRQLAPQVIEWVRLNRQALLDFWNEGDGWMDAQVQAFKTGLKPLGR